MNLPKLAHAADEAARTYSRCAAEPARTIAAPSGAERSFKRRTMLFDRRGERIESRGICRCARVLRITQLDGINVFIAVSRIHDEDSAPDVTFVLRGKERCS
jgi:hypothetical protein